ncbi:MAG: zinc ribbon domain-containing protein [Firmicutes bacterium]|nr:zinc ribbon domain-containing protein [Bacillota bacterium]
MPVFSYSCKRCGEEFTKLVRRQDQEKVRCPRCGGEELQQLFRRFNYVKITQKYDPGCGVAWNCVSAKRFGCGKYAKNKLHLPSY